MTEDNELLNVVQTANLLSICRATLMRYVDAEWGPKVIDLTPPGSRKRILRWRREEVLAFLERQTRKDNAA